VALAGGASVARPAGKQRASVVRQIRATRSGLDRAHRVTQAPSSRSRTPIAAGVEHPLPLLASAPASRAALPPTQALTFSTAGAPQVLASFAGLNLLDGRADPPDPDVAAGDGFVVEMVNGAIRVFGTDGTVRMTYQATVFFQSSSGDVTDPSIVFDPASGRWFASILDSGDGTIRLAVSQTGDPTGPWMVYDNSPGVCADQPTLGVSSTLVVIGYGGFSLPCRSSSATYQGGGQLVYNKADLLAGVTAHFTAFAPHGPFAPVSAVPSGPGPAIALTLTTPTFLEVLTYSGLPTDTSSVSETDTSLSIAVITPPPPATQKNGTAAIDTGDTRVRSGYEDPASGTIWATANDGCEPPGDATLRSCLRIIGVNGGKVVYDRDVASPGGNLFYGRIAVDGNGNAVVVHGFSSSSAFPSVGVFAVATNGGLTPSTPIAIGNEAHNDPRFGDYFGAAPDGSGGVWVVGEVGTFVTGSSFDWGTMIAHVAAGPTPPPPPPPPRDTIRPRARALASHGRRGFTALLRYEASDNSGKTREELTVYARSKLVKRISIRTSATRAGRSYAVAWHVPTGTALPLKFCVVAFDPSGNASAKSCARIAVS
jgi:hypothetical protein